MTDLLSHTMVQRGLWIGLWAALFVFCIFLSPLQVVVLLGVAVVGVSLLRWPKEGLFLLSGARVLLDVFWDIGGGSLPVLQGFAGASFVVLCWLYLRQDDESEEWRLGAWVGVAIGVLFVTFIRYPDPGDLSLLLRYITPLLVLVVMSTSIRNRDEANLTILAMALGALYPVYQTFLDAMLGNNFLLVTHEYRLRGPFHNITQASIVMSLGASFGVYGMLYFKNNVLRVVCAVYTVAALVAMHNTFARASQFYIVTFLLVLFVLQKRWVLLGMLPVGLTGVYLVSETVRERLQEIWDSLFSTNMNVLIDTDEAGSGRMGIYREALDIFQDQGPLTWLLGMGIGAQFETVGDYDVHNDWIALLLTGGVMVLVTYVGAMLYSMRVVWEFAQSGDDDDKLLAHYVLAVAIGMMLESATTNGFVARVSVGWVVMAQLGVVCGVARYRAAATSTSSVKKLPRRDAAPARVP